MIYIANPYSHKSIKIMNFRETKAAKYAAELMKEGKNCFSPIVYGHRIQHFLPENKRTDNKFWLRHNFEMLMLASELHVLTLKGWRLSKGVQFEIKTAETISLPITYVEEQKIDNNL